MVGTEMIEMMMAVIGRKAEAGGRRVLKAGTVVVPTAGAQAPRDGMIQDPRTQPEAANMQGIAALD